MSFDKELTDSVIKELRALANELESGESTLTDYEVVMDTFKVETNNVRAVRWNGWSANLMWEGPRK